MVLGAILFTSCDSSELVSDQPDMPSTDQFATSNLNNTESINVESLLVDHNHIVDAYRSLQFAAKGPNANACAPIVWVPKDYPTIQEAVDAACHPKGADINVKAGTYSEVVTVDKPDLTLKTAGDVVLQGGFNLTENADGTSIEGFTIEVTGTRGGVFAIDASNVLVQNNSILGGNDGIIAGRGEEWVVKLNNVSGGLWGITFVDVSSSIVSQNTVTGTTYTGGIYFQANSDNNQITGNTVSDTGTVNAGIMFSANITGSGDNNIIKNNITSDGNQVGIWLYSRTPEERNSDNVIQHNQANLNDITGILIGQNEILSGAENTYLFNNEAIDNDVLETGACDIIDFGVNTTFKNNTYGCLGPVTP